MQLEDLPGWNGTIELNFDIALKELEALRDFVRSVPAGTQHDFFGGDTPGACAADCVKCRAEALIKEMDSP